MKTTQALTRTWTSFEKGFQADQIYATTDHTSVWTLFVQVLTRSVRCMIIFEHVGKYVSRCENDIQIMSIQYKNGHDKGPDNFEKG